MTGVSMLGRGEPKSALCGTDNRRNRALVAVLIRLKPTGAEMLQCLETDPDQTARELLTERSRTDMRIPRQCDH